MTLRKRLFCNAKPTLLPCKTAAFGMQNNRFYNALMHSKSVGFALQKSRFRNVKAQLSLFKRIIFTK
ncbi:hypothetical protein, partial [Prevotella nigrescens]|uniref:hypothetical protein n=1 Tax=Prevotella nigrescens TaxID=28133 RepID=UPI003C73EEDA